MTFTVALAERGAEGSAEGEREGKSSDESRGRLGISVQEITPQVRETSRLESNIRGLLVAHVKEVSPAADAGLREGDVITQVNGRAITSAEEFGKIVKETHKGDYLKIYLYRPQTKASIFALVKIED